MDPNKQKLGFELIHNIRNQKVKDAMKLIQQDAPLDVKQGAGEIAVHFAAHYGLYEVLSAILKKKPKMAGEWNNNNQIPLHQAVTANKNQLETILVLLAYDSFVDTCDKNGNIPLDFALKNKMKSAVELCCLQGANPAYLRNQTWETDYSSHSNNTDEVDILQMMKEQKSLITGYLHGLISCRFSYVEGSADVEIFQSEMITANLVSIGKFIPFFVMVRTSHPQYIPKQPLESMGLLEEEIFGSVFEIRFWKLARAQAQLMIEIRKNLEKSDELILCPPTVGKIIKYDRKENVVFVHVNLKLRKNNDPIMFAFLTDEKQELFEVSNNKEQKFKPEMEPEAEIDVPPAAFEKPGRLALKIADTKEANENEKEENSHRIKEGENADSKDIPLLASRVLQIQMVEGTQPKKPINMKLPIANIDKSEKVVVVGSSKSDPDVNNPDDIDEIEAKRDATGKFAIFQINHFSFYVVAAKVKVNEKRAETIEAAMDSINKMRHINFALCVNKPEEGRREMSFILLCGNRKRIANMILKWGREGYELAGEVSESFKRPEGKEFKLSITGNVKETSDSEEIILKFQGNQEDNYRIMQVSASLDETEIVGIVTVYEEDKMFEEIVVKKVESNGLCAKAEIREEKIRTNERIENRKMKDLLFNLKLPKLENKTLLQLKHEEEEHKLNEEKAIRKFKELAETHADSDTTSLEFFEKTHKELIQKDQSVIKPLTFISLYSLAVNLSLNEWKHFASNLHLRKISETGNVKYNAFLVLKDWRGLRPHIDQLRRLCRALESSNKKEYSDYIKKAQLLDISVNFALIDENGCCKDHRLSLNNAIENNLDDYDFENNYKRKKKTVLLKNKTQDKQIDTPDEPQSSNGNHTFEKTECDINTDDKISNEVPIHQDIDKDGDNKLNPLQGDQKSKETSGQEKTDAETEETKN